jgi:hypothetical protein
LRDVSTVTDENGREFQAVNTADGGQIKMRVENDVPENERPTGEETQQALSTLADLHERNPLPDGSVPSMRVISESNAEDITGTKGVAAFVSSQNPSQVTLVGHGPFEVTGPATQPEWSMPSAANVTPVQYNVAHEYGHVTALSGGELEPATRNATQIAATSVDRAAGGLSKYGAMNSNEGYAEAHAEYSLTRGTTTNAAAQTYAKVAGWKA